MSIYIRSLTLLACLASTYQCLAFEAVYAFDTVNAIDFGSDIPVITGIERNTGKTIVAGFIDETNERSSHIASRCVPIILTAIEKPGKYYLTLLIETDRSHQTLRSCKLELRP